MSEIDQTLDNVVSFKYLRMLSLYGNPIALLPNYKKALLRELFGIQYFDEEKLYEDEEDLAK